MLWRGALDILAHSILYTSPILMQPKNIVAKLAVGAVFVGLLAALSGFVAIRYFVLPDLPSVDSLKEVQFQVPLRIYTRTGELIAEFGEKKRTPVEYVQIPEQMIQAFLAAEDDRFFEHPGVDYQGLLRAALELLKTGEKRQGGSTITMQVARNFFLSNEKTYFRKLSEILLALKIEQELSKEEILALYLNKIYLGHRAYGVVAAAQVYYGKSLDELTSAEIAMIAGLPKAPSRYNPITNPERATTRRDYVLGRMRTLGYIDDLVYQDAVAQVDQSRLQATVMATEAPYVAEMARAEVYERFGEAAYESGYSVVTTLDGADQRAANRALRKALLDYDVRHGYRGPESNVALAGLPTQEELEAALTRFRPIGGLLPAVVTLVGDAEVGVYVQEAGDAVIDWPGLEWAAPYIDEKRIGDKPKSAADVVRVGDIVRVVLRDDGGLQLSQLPNVEGALVSLSPSDGSVLALVGGFEFNRSKFNRAVQGERQPGSNFKPFIYSAALSKGYTPASVLNDAPVVFDDPGLEDTWRPENYSGKFFGPTRLRKALVQSRNLVSIRLLRSIGVPYALDHVARYGFDPSSLPHDLSLALGSGVVTPLQLVSGYAVIANGGYLVEPYFIDRIEDSNGRVVYAADPLVVCDKCPDQALEESADAAEPVVRFESRVAPRNLDVRDNYLLVSMMREVITSGTGRRARSLKRNDIAGKTGTTNDQKDAWFSGFNRDVVTTVWVGFDQVRSLGAAETGSRAALPMWIDYMAEALRNSPDVPLPEPPGMVTARIDPETGLLARAGNPDAEFEIFRSDNLPAAEEEVTIPVDNGGTRTEGREPQMQLF